MLHGYGSTSESYSPARASYVLMYQDMTDEVMSAICDMAQAIYKGNDTLKDCRERIYKIYKVNENSFATYYRAFKCMMDGSRHTHGINVELRDYMLTRIHREYGLERYKIALNAYLMYINYDEEHKHINKIKERELYKKHYRIISNLI